MEINKTEPTLAALVKRESTNIVEALQAGGHVPDVDAQTAEPIDWLRTLLDTTADLALECRYELSDPETNAAVRRRLAKLVALCEAWDAQLR